MNVWYYPGRLIMQTSLFKGVKQKPWDYVGTSEKGKIFAQLLMELDKKLVSKICTYAGEMIIDKAIDSQSMGDVMFKFISVKEQVGFTLGIMMKCKIEDKYVIAAQNQLVHYLTDKVYAGKMDKKRGLEVAALLSKSSQIKGEVDMFDTKMPLSKSVELGVFPQARYDMAFLAFLNGWLPHVGSKDSKPEEALLRLAKFLSDPEKFSLLHVRMRALITAHGNKKGCSCPVSLGS
jgi:hypothetical protein